MVRRGDFICDPNAPAESGFVDLICEAIHAPDDFTCGNMTYDYFIVSRGLSAIVHSVKVISNSLFHSHCAVGIFLRTSPRSMLVRALKAPRGFPARLPFGPDNHRTVAAASTANEIAVGSSLPRAVVDAEFTSCFQ